MLHSASSCEQWSIFTKLRADKMRNQRKHEKIDFVTIKISIGYKEACKRCPFALQNMPFYTSKDALLHCKRASFRTQKGVDWKVRRKGIDKRGAELRKEKRPPQAPPKEGMWEDTVGYGWLAKPWVTASPSPSEGGDVPGGIRNAGCWGDRRMKNWNYERMKNQVQRIMSK